MTQIFDMLNQVVIALAASPWIYAIVLALVIIDGFFPPVPSESVVVGLAAIAISTGAPNILLLVAVSAIGAAIGDNIAFSLGRRFGADGVRWMRGPRVTRVLDRVHAELDRRAGTVILIGRFVPVGRVVVNTVAGASGFARSRFVRLTLLSGAVWAGYSVVIGVLAGSWMHHNPILGATLAIVVALVIGFAVDAATAAISRRRRHAAGAPAAS